MVQPLSRSASKVQKYLAEQAVEFVVKELPSSTRTAKEAAESIGCQVAQIAKSIVFKNAEKQTPVLVVASGSNHIDTDKIEKQLGIQLCKADADFVKSNLGYAIGGVPPVAHSQRVLTILDQDLYNYTSLWAAAGTPNAVFELSPQDLDLLTHGQWIDLAK